MQPSVSIIIPVYNVEDYIEDCLKSVISQTYQGKIECIIVDDCTPDNSCKKIEEILSTYTGNIEFKVIHHEVNKGLSAARNTGIKQATGEWLYFLDSDDELYDYTIEHLTELIPYNEVASIIMGGYSIINTNNTGIFKEDKLYQTVTLDNNESIINSLIEGKWNVMAWNKLVNHSFITNNNLYFEEGIIHEDELWTFIFLPFIKKLIISTKITYIYKIRKNSIMNTFNIHERKSYTLIIKNMKSTYIQHKEKLRFYFRNYYYSSIIRILTPKMSINQNYRLYNLYDYINIDYKNKWFHYILNYTLKYKNPFNFYITYFVACIYKIYRLLK